MNKKGEAFLWYPGNQVIVKSRWRLAGIRTAAGIVDAICSLSGSETYNPVSHQFGGRWECTSVIAHQSRIVEKSPGDPFGLGRARQVPFVLGKDRTTFAELLARRQ